MDEAGYDCSSNVGLDCLDVFDSDQFLSWGYTFDQWLEVLYNCPQSCGLDCISETCDVSSLLENATEFGSCSAELTSGTSSLTHRGMDFLARRRYAFTVFCWRAFVKVNVQTALFLGPFPFSSSPF